MDRLQKIYSDTYFRTFMIIFVIIVGLLCAYKVSKYIYQRRKNNIYLIEGIKDGRVAQTIGGDMLLPSQVGYEFTFSTWFYIKDWGYKYDMPKYVFQFGKDDSPHPRVSLYPQKNSMKIEMDTYNRGIKTCDISDIKVQRWNHLGLVLQNKTLDVYVNGSLARSCTFEYVPKLSQGGDLLVSPNGGFEGIISDLFYSNKAFSPNQMNYMYRKGHTHVDLVKYFTEIYPEIQNVEKKIQCIKKI